MTRITCAATAGARRRAIGLAACCVLVAGAVPALAQVPARRLVISVREVDAGLRSTVTISGGGALAAPGAKVVSTTDARDANRIADVIERIQVIDGGVAWIAAGGSSYQPEVVGVGSGQGGIGTGSSTGTGTGTGTNSRGNGPRVDAVAVQDNSGFAVTPHLKGGRVSVDVTRVRDRSSAWSGSDADRLSTRLEGRLGEWLSLANLDAGMHGRVGAVQGSSADDSARRRFEIRIDEVAPSR